VSWPVLLASFAGLLGIALLVDLPPWMVAVGAVLAVIGFLLERQRG
jgi:hypothetical protein